MPTYEYECTKCGHRFEKFQGINDKPVSKCPRCAGKVKRLISGGSGLIFKGSGFYITENRSASYKKGAKSESGGGEGAKGGDSGKAGTGGDAGPKKESSPAPKPKPPGKSGD
jgi:putative FmdB family regulatory protein